MDVQYQVVGSHSGYFKSVGFHIGYAVVGLSTSCSAKVLATSRVSRNFLHSEQFLISIF